MNRDWITTLMQLQREGRNAVIVSVASTVGSTPREAGARMIVTRDDLYGTIGGGNLEYQACNIVRDLLNSGAENHLRRFPLGASLGQCCGGLVNLLFEPVTASTSWLEEAQSLIRLNTDWVRIVPTRDNGKETETDYFFYSAGEVVCNVTDVDLKQELGLVARELLTATGQTRLFQASSNKASYYAEVQPAAGINLTLFGAGHVGRAVVNILSDLDIHIRWVDSREEQFANIAACGVEIICHDCPESEVDAAPVGSYFLVMTHDHGLDQRLTEQILKRGDFNYFGLIGSHSKRRNFETRMQRRGLDPALFKQLTCPVGMPGIDSKQPAVIAISVAAQIMQVYDQGGLQTAKVTNELIKVR